MTRKQEMQSKAPGRLRKAADAVKRVFTREHSAEESVRDASAGRERNASPNTTEATARTAQPKRPRTTAPQTARATRREADIPLDVLDRAYTPPVTSSKTSFRSDGADHHQDQEFSRGTADLNWNDEDHFTNKSGDPRIGTRRRTYEPNEQRDESRDEQR